MTEQPQRPDVDSWHDFDDSNFDGLEWPVAEFEKGADYIEYLESELRKMADEFR